ncbi:MAG: BlaI/MecI/CopY family transcriptional regulator, partial [Lachnospiraceae bacterium]|nr:BlaI/MecI/CopY family transcriptional regulator [Lachnospiraceae bacterium]
ARRTASCGGGPTTTYTVLKKCIDKGAIERFEPNFVCHALVTRKQAQEYETAELLDKMYNGRADRLVASLIGSKRLTEKEIGELKKLLEDLE